MKRKFCSAIIVIAVSMCLCTTAYATNESTYSDVPYGSTYYEAVEWLTENGVINGTENGEFSPNRPITIDEFTKMIICLFYNNEWPCGAPVSGPDWAKNYVWTAEQIGLYVYSDYLDMSTNGISRMRAWTFLVNASSLNPYPAWFYTNSAPAFNLSDDIETAMYTTGLYDTQVDRDDIPTRGEIAVLMYRLATGQYESQLEPDIWQNVHVIIEDPNDTWRTRNSAMYDWTLIPDKYKNSFIKNEWTIRITKTVCTYYPDYFTANAMTDMDTHVITLGSILYPMNSNVLVHEMGHYIMIASNTDFVGVNILNTESDALSELIGTNYCKTNSWEAFAEAFSYVIRHLNDANTYMLMKERIPLTLSYIEKVYLEANGLADNQMACQLTIEHFTQLVRPMPIQAVFLNRIGLS